MLSFLSNDLYSVLCLILCCCVTSLCNAPSFVPLICLVIFYSTACSIICYCLPCCCYELLHCSCLFLVVVFFFFFHYGVWTIDWCYTVSWSLACYCFKVASLTLCRIINGVRIFKWLKGKIILKINFNHFLKRYIHKTQHKTKLRREKGGKDWMKKNRICDGMGRGICHWTGRPYVLSVTALAHSAVWN